MKTNTIQVSGNSVTNGRYYQSFGVYLHQSHYSTHRHKTTPLDRSN